MKISRIHEVVVHASRRARRLSTSPEDLRFDSECAVPSAAAPDTRCRARLRFSLRSLFGLLLLCAVASLWLERRISVLEKQRRALERLSTIGARIESEPAFPCWFWRYIPRWLCHNRDIARSVEIIRDRVTVDDIAPIADLTSLRSVTIRADGPTDNELAIAVGTLRQLEYANLPERGVADECLRAITAANGLRRLHLTHAHPSPTGVSCLARLTRLETLDFYNAQISDEALTAILPMKRLTWLRLPGNLSAASLRSLPALSALAKLDLHLGTAGDDGLADLWLLPRLRSLEIRGAGYCGRGPTDAGLAYIVRITTLEQLKIISGTLTVSGVLTLRNMPALKLLSINDSGIKIVDQPALTDAFPGVRVRVLETSRTAMERPSHSAGCPTGDMTNTIDTSHVPEKVKRRSN